MRRHRIGGHVAVPIEQAVQHCLRVWLHAAVAAAAASERAAAEAGATCSDPEQQAVQRYLMSRSDVVAAELGKRAAATPLSYGVLATAVRVATGSVEQSVQHYSRTCLNATVAAELAARRVAKL